MSNSDYDPLGYGQVRLGKGEAKGQQKAEASASPEDILFAQDDKPLPGPAEPRRSLQDLQWDLPGKLEDAPVSSEPVVSKPEIDEKAMQAMVAEELFAQPDIKQEPKPKSKFESKPLAKPAAKPQPYSGPNQAGPNQAGMSPRRPSPAPRPVQATEMAKPPVQEKSVPQPAPLPMPQLTMMQPVAPTPSLAKSLPLIVIVLGLLVSGVIWMATGQLIVSGFVAAISLVGAPMLRLLLLD